MSHIRAALFATTFGLLLTQVGVAADAQFSGSWSLDLRSEEQRAAKAECGEASFVLKQSGSQITGSHTFSAVGCGRLNEGGKGTVKGKVVGKVAYLVITSGRNGAVVRGVATLKHGALYWETKEELKAGALERDSPLILGKGLLSKIGT